MRVGLLVIDVFLRGSASLKDKRRVIRAISDRARSRHNVATAEIEHQDLRQRGTLAFVSVADRQEPLERLFDRLVEEADRVVPGGISEISREFLG
ncbi:MAG: DUF503 domain-containing protein [Acidobacteriota bacterium]|nr:DUF503 domain-containing protein [Acidobacteriota bacterium]MDQ7087949.1 DUF503 domain-containing protein [Acidobacteriota bacterium]